MSVSVTGKFRIIANTSPMSIVINIDECEIGNDGCFYLGNLKAKQMQTLSLCIKVLMKGKIWLETKDARVYQEDNGRVFSGYL